MERALGVPPAAPGRVLSGFAALPSLRDRLAPPLPSPDAIRARIVLISEPDNGNNQGVGDGPGSQPTTRPLVRPPE